MTSILHRHAAVFTELALVAAVVSVIAGLCLALVWVAPLEFAPPRPR